MSKTNKLLLFLMLTVLFGYLVILGVSLYRNYVRTQTPPASSSVSAPAGEEVVPTPVAVDPEDPAIRAARDAERAVERVTAWKAALNAAYRSQTEIERGEIDSAIDRLERAVEEAPLVVDLKLALADLYMGQKRYTDARDMYMRILDVDPLRDGVGLKWAQALHALRHHEAALTVALWLLEGDSFLEEPNQIAALAYIAMDRTADAVPHLRRQISVNRENVVAQNNLAVAYSRLGEYARAVTLFLEVLDADPGNAITYYNLAVCYSQQGDTRQAVETLQHAAERFGHSFVSAWFRSKDFDPIRESEAFRNLQEMDDDTEE